MTFLINLFRGFRGHPAHPPLTDLTIGAYTVGSVLVLLSWGGIASDKTLWGGFIAIAIGLVGALPTIATGFFDFLKIPRGTGARKVAHLHWVTMVSATAVFMVAEALLQSSFDSGRPVSAAAGVLTAVALAMITAGGYFGGTIVFEYGLRVLNEPPSTPATQTLKPKWPPE